MNIKRNTSVAEVQKEFQSNFPGLKVEFYFGNHAFKNGSPKSKEVKNTNLLVDLNPELKEGELDLKKDVMTFELEDQFMKLFGLNIQVFRNSKNVWLQTTKTDNWSLGKQNRKGISSKNI